MGEDTDIVEELHTRIRELEDKVEALRISRRVLMNLMDAMEKEKIEQLKKLSYQNDKLQKCNYRYARSIMYQNIKINKLEEQLQTEKTGKNRTGNTFT